jgi:flagellar motor protein MotB
VQTIRTMAVQARNGGTIHRGMATDDWDEIDLDKERPQPPPIPGSAPKRGGRAMRLGWLTALLFAAAGAAVAALAMESHVDHSNELARARDESAELRRTLFVAQDRLIHTDQSRKAEAAKAAQLDEQLKAKGAEKDEDAKLIADLKAKLDDKEGDVTSQGKNIAVNFVDEILFASGEATLSPHGREVLGKVGGVLKDLKEQQILVGGHTDDRPIHTAAFPSNWELSAARAVNVARYLVETAGIDPHRVVAAGYSEFHPRGKDRAKNRRIELLLTPTVEVKRQ